MMPVDIRRTPHFIEDDKGWDTKLVGRPLPREMYNDGTMYGNGLQFRLIEEGKNKNIRRRRNFVRSKGLYLD